MHRTPFWLILLVVASTAAAQQPYPSTNSPSTIGNPSTIGPQPAQQPYRQAQQQPIAQPVAQPQAQLQPQPPMQPQAQTQPRAPFTNSPQEQAYLDNVLIAWEKKSAEVKNFQGEFTRWKYNSFGPPPKNLFSEDAGMLSYRAPDCGSFEIKKSLVWTPAPRAPGEQGEIKGEYKEQESINEHWVCDGKNIYEFRVNEKQLVERPIPPEMQGQRIVDGPLPFLFGAEAEKLKARFWMRIDKRLSNEQHVGILAMPKYQVDAANYKAVQVVLDAKHEHLLPIGIVVHHLDGSRDAYQFHLDKAQVNRQFGQLFAALFAAPRTPYGWKRVVEPPAADPARQAAVPQQPPQ